MSSWKKPASRQDRYSCSDSVGSLERSLVKDNVPRLAVGTLSGKGGI